VTGHSWVPIPRSAIQGGEHKLKHLARNLIYADEKSGRSKEFFLNKTVVKALGYKTPWCIARGTVRDRNNQTSAANFVGFPKG